MTLADELRTIGEAEQDARDRVQKARDDARALILAAEDEGRQIAVMAREQAADEVARYRDAELARAADEAVRLVRSAERDAAALRSRQQALVRDAAHLIVQAVTGERDVVPG